MKSSPLTKKQINDAANAHALEILGLEEFKKNRASKQSITDDFKSAVEWAMKAMLQLHDSPGDPAHRLITTERLTQISRGFDAEHDAQYNKQQLAIAGILMVAEGTQLEPLLKTVDWPIKGYPDKRGKLDQVRQRVIGATLIAGQIDYDIEVAKSWTESEVANG